MEYLFTRGSVKFLLSLVFVSFSAFSAFSAPLIDRAWEGISDPLRMSLSFNRKFSELPLEGKIEDQQKLWSGDYWANSKGNINYRWHAPTPSGFNLISPTKVEAAAMTAEQIGQLAPSEKFDLFRGNYEYPLRSEVERYFANPSALSWEGICHGWAAAAMNHREPIAKVVTNPDGILIPFGSSDIKALISYYYANKNKVLTTHQMGRRCSSGESGPDTCNNDMNAGAFHLVLSNRLGLQGETFIADMNNGLEVWNHPLHSYTSIVVEESKVLNPTSAPGTVKIARVLTELKYVLETWQNSWDGVIGTDNQLYRVAHFEYWVDLNENDEIIGGDWISKERPDFLWLMDSLVTFKGDFARLTELLNDGP